MIEHFRTALRAAVAAADAWMDSSDRSRSSKTYAGMEAACSAVALSVPDARRMLAALDHMEALTQRQMIAALYWRAGATMVLAERAEKAGNGPRAERLINDGAGTWNAARAMEAACPR